MEHIYTSYKCCRCGKSIILLTGEVNNTIGQGKYLSCAHCGCKKLRFESKTSDLREIMKSRKYKRNSRGALIEF